MPDFPECFGTEGEPLRILDRKRASDVLVKHGLHAPEYQNTNHEDGA